MSQDLAELLESLNIQQPKADEPAEKVATPEVKVVTPEVKDPNDLESLVAAVTGPPATPEVVAEIAAEKTVEPVDEDYAAIAAETADEPVAAEPKLDVPATANVPASLSDMLDQMKSPGPALADLERLVSDPKEAFVEEDKEQEELYKQITLIGLKKYRSDLVTILQASKPKAKSKPKTPKTSGDPVADYVSYLESAKAIYASDPTKVSSRRLTTIRKKFLAAIESLKITVEKDSEPVFSVDPAEGIVGVWYGPVPEGLPTALKL